MKLIPKTLVKEMKKSVKKSVQEIHDQVAGKAHDLFERRVIFMVMMWRTG